MWNLEWHNLRSSKITALVWLVCTSTVQENYNISAASIHLSSVLSSRGLSEMKSEQTNQTTVAVSVSGKQMADVSHCQMPATLTTLWAGWPRRGTLLYKHILLTTVKKLCRNNLSKDRLAGRQKEGHIDGQPSRQNIYMVRKTEKNGWKSFFVCTTLAFSITVVVLGR